MSVAEFSGDYLPFRGNASGKKERKLVSAIKETMGKERERVVDSLVIFFVCCKVCLFERKEGIKK